MTRLPIDATEADCKIWIKELHTEGRLFHFEDEPADIIDMQTNEPLFTPEECEITEHNVEIIFRAMPDPFDYALSLLNHSA